MISRLLRRQAGHEDRLWPVLLLLVLLVLVPTAVLTWLVGQAARNERIVVRQRLAETYVAELERAQSDVETYFASRLERSDHWLDAVAQGIAPPFSIGDLADAVVCFDEQGRLIRPKPLPPLGADLLRDSDPWRAAERTEFQQGDPRRAADAYAAIAAASEHPDVTARAMLAQARCLDKSGDRTEGITVLRRIVESPLGQHARDAQQRLIALDAGLRALELLQQEAGSVNAIKSVRRRLLEWIAPEHASLAPSSQRRFVGRRLQELFPGEIELPWLNGEELAARYAAMYSAPPRPGSVQPTALPAVWQVASPHRRVVLLFREATLERDLADRLHSTSQGPAIRVAVLPPGGEAPADKHLASAPADAMAGWRLALVGDAILTPDTVAGRQVAVYGWTALLAVAAAIVAACGLARAVGRQHRLRRLQNNWLETVSHELKTPLSSIHLLTDALLEGDGVDRAEYLRMISAETTRLTRLIERLLLASRLKAGAAPIDRRPVQPEDIATAASGALGDRLHSRGCAFSVHCAADLPEVFADPDALTTALVNLLENAWKFTGPEKRISLQVFRDGDSVSFAVADNGTGLSARDARRVFDRFYQVDRRLSRDQGGCGLGLSIVKQLAEAHGGTVSVESEPGAGSTFTIRLPAMAADPTNGTHDTR